MAEIPDGFLSTLGDRFLAHLYRHISGSQVAFLFLALRNGEVVGFIAGCENTGALYKEYFRSSFFFICLRLLPIVFSGQTVQKVYETLRYPHRRVAVPLPEPEILNFCVRSDQQGHGIGGKLFGVLTEEFKRRGVAEIRIITGAKQMSAQRFYESRNARFAGEVSIHQGVGSRAYVYPVP